MGLILNIETATKTCSVALAQDGKLLSLVEEHDIQSHASKLTLFIKEVFAKANRSLEELDAIAVSIGPGSYTGLRIGLSTSKGLCYALNKPLITVDTLLALAYGMRKVHPDKDAFYIPNMDARRNEVYYAILDYDLNFIKNTETLILDEKSFNIYQKKLIIGGNGSKKIDNIANYHIFTKIHIQHSSENMILISDELLNNNNLSDVVYLEPNYLKPFKGF